VGDDVVDDSQYVCVLKAIFIFLFLRVMSDGTDVLVFDFCGFYARLRLAWMEWIYSGSGLAMERRDKGRKWGGNRNTAL
jgi:hypothetical protein